MRRFTILRQFEKDELLINEDETRIILKFIFAHLPESTIETLPMSDELRGFTQALLLTAIDATYSIGFVEGIFRTTANPSKGALKIIKGFARRSARHWFRHASANDLTDVKIYEFVRDEIARRFRTQLMEVSTSQINMNCCGAFVQFVRPVNGLLKVWG